MNLTIRFRNPHKLMEMMIRPFLPPNTTITNQDFSVLYRVRHSLLIVDVDVGKDEFHRITIIVPVKNSVIEDLAVNAECFAALVEIVQFGFPSGASADLRMALEEFVDVF